LLCAPRRQPHRPMPSERHSSNQVGCFGRSGDRGRSFPRVPQLAQLDELTSMGANQPQLPLDRHLSIFVTDVETVNQIKFSEVMEQLVKQSGDPFLTKIILFHQWWDGAGQRPGLGLGPHCDNESARKFGLTKPGSGRLRKTGSREFWPSPRTRYLIWRGHTGANAPYPAPSDAGPTADMP
jgi:hypothetical protein